MQIFRENCFTWKGNVKSHDTDYLLVHYSIPRVEASIRGNMTNSTVLIVIINVERGTLDWFGKMTWSLTPSVECAISTTLHLTLSHLERKNAYAEEVFSINFSSAFYTIILAAGGKAEAARSGHCNLQLGFRLPDKGAADSQGGESHIKNYLSEHRLT